MNIMAMAKGAQRYVFLYDDESCDELVEAFDRYAANPDMNFMPGDAALLTMKVRVSAQRQAPIVRRSG